MLDDQEVVLLLLTGIVVWSVLLLIDFLFIYLFWNPNVRLKNNHKMLDQ